MLHRPDWRGVAAAGTSERGRGLVAYATVGGFGEPWRFAPGGVTSPRRKPRAVLVNASCCFAATICQTGLRPRRTRPRRRAGASPDWPKNRAVRKRRSLFTSSRGGEIRRKHGTWTALNPSADTARSPRPSEGALTSRTPFDPTFHGDLASPASRPLPGYRR